MEFQSFVFGKQQVLVQLSIILTGASVVEICCQPLAAINDLKLVKF